MTEEPSFSPGSLEIHLLGKFRVLIQGNPVVEHHWSRRSARLLVKLLALQPNHSLHREEAMERLWPELDLDAAANNLYKTIHAARRALEPELTQRVKSQFINIKSQQILLEAPQKLWVDVEEFEQSAKQALKGTDAGAYELALTLYTGDLLPEDPYEDWAAFRREQLRHLYLELLSKLSALYQKNNQFTRSIEWLKVLTTQEPADEQAHCRLMRLYALTGEKGKAMLQYDLCRGALRRELDADIEHATEKLYRQIVAGQVAPLRSSLVEVTLPSFRQITFRRGTVHSARFATGDQNIYYAASWEGNPAAVFATRESALEVKAKVLADSRLLAVSAAGEVAVLCRPRHLRGYLHSGGLATVEPGSEAPQEILNEVQEADWGPTAREFAVVREVGGRTRLEFPIGNLLYETGGWISHARISPGGDLIAFLDHPFAADDDGLVCAVDRGGKKKHLGGEWASAQGLAWSADGSEVWFTAAKVGRDRALYAAGIEGGERLVYRLPGNLTLHDISRDGKVLLARDHTRMAIISLPPGARPEKELSWLDWSLARDLSSDGKCLLFTEAGEGGGAKYSVYLRQTAGQTAVRLGEGSALALSPDGQWALVKSHGALSRLTLLPTTASGAARRLEGADLNYHQWACWLPDGQRIVFAANEPRPPARLYLQDLRQGKPRAITPEGVYLSSPQAISPDGRLIAAIGSDELLRLYPVEGGKALLVAGSQAGDHLIRWSQEGDALFTFRRGELPTRICRLELATGRKELWRQIMPAEVAGIQEILKVLMTPDAETLVYTFTRDLSDLYLVEGLN